MVLLEAMQCHNIDIDTRDQVNYVRHCSLRTTNAITRQNCILFLSTQINRTALHRASYQGHRECVQALISHGANLAAVTKTGVTAVDAIFAHISRPMTFLTDILDSCVRTTNNSPLEKYENVRIALLLPLEDALQIQISYFLYYYCNFYQILMNGMSVKDHGRLWYISSKAPDANGSGHGHYSCSFGYKTTGNITASTCGDISQTKMGEIKDTFLSSYTYTLSFRYFSLSLRHNIRT